MISKQLKMVRNAHVPILYYTFISEYEKCITLYNTRWKFSDKF